MAKMGELYFATGPGKKNTRSNLKNKLKTKTGGMAQVVE
jgi:hypothetical protein